MNDSLCSGDPPIINKNVSLKMTGSWKARDPLGVGTVSCCKCKENCPLIWDTVKTPTFPCTVAPQIKTDIGSAVTSRKHINSFENIMPVFRLGWGYLKDLGENSSGLFKIYCGKLPFSFSKRTRAYESPTWGQSIWSAKFPLLPEKGQV